MAMTSTAPPGAPPTPAELRDIEDVRARWDAVGPAREAHLRAIAELAEIPREIVGSLRGQGLRQEDIAEVLGVSRQRVQQLDPSATKRKPRRTTRGRAPRKPAAPVSGDEVAQGA